MRESGQEEARERGNEPVPVAVPEAEESNEIAVVSRPEDREKIRVLRGLMAAIGCPDNGKRHWSNPRVKAEGIRAGHIQSIVQRRDRKRVARPKKREEALQIARPRPLNR